MTKRLIIKYSNNYWVKVTLKTIKETEDEGGGWYSYTGKTFRSCYITRIKYHRQIPTSPKTIEDLSADDLEIYNKAVAEYENSNYHKERLKSNCKIKLTN